MIYLPLHTWMQHCQVKPYSCVSGMSGSSTRNMCTSCTLTLNHSDGVLWIIQLFHPVWRMKLEVVNLFCRQTLGAKVVIYSSPPPLREATQKNIQDISVLKKYLNVQVLKLQASSCLYTTLSLVSYHVNDQHSRKIMLSAVNFQMHFKYSLTIFLLITWVYFNSTAWMMFLWSVG